MDPHFLFHRMSELRNERDRLTTQGNNIMRFLLVLVCRVCFSNCPPKPEVWGSTPIAHHLLFTNCPSLTEASEQSKPITEFHKGHIAYQNIRA
jgi:hypothetical protein